MANPNGLVMMPTRDNMSLTLLAKPVFCHEGNLIGHGVQNSCWFTSSRSQNCHNIFIYCFLLLSLGCFFVLIGSYYLPSQRKHKVLEGKDA